jgi:hypothetical protein
MNHEIDAYEDRFPANLYGRERYRVYSETHRARSYSDLHRAILKARELFMDPTGQRGMDCSPVLILAGHGSSARTVGAWRVDGWHWMRDGLRQSEDPTPDPYYQREGARR